LDVHEFLTRIYNPGLARLLQRIYAECGEECLYAARLLEEWRDSLWHSYGEGFWDRRLEAAEDLLRLEERAAAYIPRSLRGELAAFVDEMLEALGTSRSELGGGGEAEAAGGEQPGGAEEAADVGEREVVGDLHQFVTRVVNPVLTPLLVEMRKGRRVLRGRSYVTGLRWSVFSPLDEVASALEEWREDLWRLYGEDYYERRDEVFYSLLRVVAKATYVLGEDSWIVDELWRLTRRVAGYFSMQQRLPEAEATVRRMVEELRARDEALRLAQARYGARRGRARATTGSRRRLPRTTRPRRTRSAAAPRAVASRPPRRGGGGGRLASVIVLAVVLLSLVAFAAQWGGEAARLGSVTPSTKPWGSGCSGQAYTVEEALRCYLADPREEAVLRGLAKRLRGGTLADSAWNVLEWEEEHVDYDWGRRDALRSRVALPIQRPSETVRRGRGVCVDYAVLTAGVLAYMGYPVYVFAINFTGPGGVLGHAAAAVKIGGEYYMLDQRLPPMPLPAYYDYWAYYREGVYEGHRLENLRIKEARVYLVELRGGSVHVEAVGVFSASRFRASPRHASRGDLELLAATMARLIRDEHPNLVLDPGIGGSAYRVEWSYEIPVLAEAYSPIFADRYAEWIYSEMAGNARFTADLVRYRRLWVECIADGDSIVVKVYLAYP